MIRYSLVVLNVLLNTNQPTITYIGISILNTFVLVLYTKERQFISVTCNDKLADKQTNKLIDAVVCKTVDIVAAELTIGQWLVKQVNKSMVTWVTGQYL